MDPELRSALDKLATELTTPVARSRDEWVRGNNAGTATAGKRLKELLDKYPPVAVTTRTAYGYEQAGKPVVGSWHNLEDVEAVIASKHAPAELVTRQVSTTPWVAVHGAAPIGLAHLPER